MKQIILGLGSNLGKPVENLAKAVGLIEERLLSNIVKSKIYRFPALMPDGAPAEWDIDFANMVVSGELKDSRITPETFLNAVKKIEFEMGRVEAARWAPRVIDIDILAWGDEVVEAPDLLIPHYGLLEREFTLVPLNEILPDWVHPVSGKAVREYVAELELWKYLEY